MIDETQPDQERESDRNRQKTGRRLRSKQLPRKEQKQKRSGNKDEGIGHHWLKWGPIKWKETSQEQAECGREFMA